MQACMVVIAASEDVTFVGSVTDDPQVTVMNIHYKQLLDLFILPEQVDDVGSAMQLLIVVMSVLMVLQVELLQVLVILMGRLVLPLKLNDQ